MINKFNPFHLVEQRPWPILASNAGLCLVLRGLAWINHFTYLPAVTSLLTILAISYIWWRDIHRESTSQGNHSDIVINGLKTGMVLFIISEVFFFVSFFWAFFHRRISPTVELGQIWPPISINSFNPMRIPLLNTILLLSSGVSVTWAHHAIIKRIKARATKALALTILLGGIFTLFQGFEYTEAPFCMADSAFGSTFFIATGFHGLHVIIGSIFLTVSLFRFVKINASSSHMVGFECAAWYWHFVDVVWLFLYSILYWWGSYSF